MRSIGVVVETVVELPRPARATQTQANLLGISVGDLVLQIERTIYDTDRRPVETADIVIPDVRRKWPTSSWSTSRSPSKPVEAN